MKQIRILLAEDNPDHSMLLTRAIHKGNADAAVTSVTDREQFIFAVRTKSFDCVILDFNLPPFTAIDLLADLDQHQPGVARIVVSCSEEQRIVVESLRVGVTDFLPKTDAIQSDKLWARITPAIERTHTKQLERRKINRRLADLQRRLRQDPLTGLLNRRGAELVLGASRSGGRDRRESTGVIFVDLDHFKSINDTFGHVEGDHILRQTARIIKSSISATDIAVRWGGEEMVIFRQSDSLPDAWAFADSIRRVIQDQVTVSRDPDWRVTASVGVDLVPSNSLCADSVQRADQAMYLAKETGRNRVCTWNMVHVIDTVLNSGMHVGMTPIEKLRVTLTRLWNELGETQRDHTGEHGRIVKELSRRVAQRLGIDSKFFSDLDLAAEFHDIGKLGIPESLLALPRSLQEDERRFINEHIQFGADLLKACGAPQPVIAAVQNHHTRFDQANQSAISLESIISTCDAVAAMQSERPYSPPMPLDSVIRELRTQRGSQFHPDVVDSLITEIVGESAVAA